MNATKKVGSSELNLEFWLETINGHDSSNYSNPVVDRRAADLALQRRVGLLSDRRPWPAASNRFDACIVQSYLAGLVHVGRRLRDVGEASRFALWEEAKRDASPTSRSRRPIFNATLRQGLLKYR
jgi:hypothetical protein